MSQQPLSTTRRESFLRCPRHHHNRYELGYRSLREVTVRQLGTAMRTALGTWWEYWRTDDAGNALKEALTALHETAPEECDPFAMVRLEVLLHGYDARWTSTMTEIEILAVEEYFDIPLVNPETGQESTDFHVVGEIDAIIRWQDRLYILEPTTTSFKLQPDSRYWTSLRMKGQSSIYVDGARALGYRDIAGCIYDVIRKPSLRPYSATPEESRKYRNDGTLYAQQRECDESEEEYRARLTDDIARKPAEYYQRAEMIGRDQELAEDRRDLWRTAELIKAGSKGIPPRNLDACHRYGRPCEYLDICSGDASLDDESQFVVTKHNWDWKSLIV